MLAHFLVLIIVRTDGREDFGGDYVHDEDAHRDGAAVCRADATAVSYKVVKSYY